MNNTKTVLIYDVEIKPGVEFSNKPQLMSNDYFMVFSQWRPSLLKSKKNSAIRPLSPFVSWYPIRKDLFNVVDGEIRCKGDYMSEKLSASTSSDQDFALQQINNACQHGTANVGTITQVIKRKRRICILEGVFEGIGKIIFADHGRHPALQGKGYSQKQTSGLNAYPWTPIGNEVEFRGAFKI